MQSKSPKRAEFCGAPNPFLNAAPGYALLALWGRTAVETAFFPARVGTSLLSAALGLMSPTSGLPRIETAPLSRCNVIHVDFRR